MKAEDVRNGYFLLGRYKALREEEDALPRIEIIRDNDGRATAAHFASGWGNHPDPPIRDVPIDVECLRRLYREGIRQQLEEVETELRTLGIDLNDV